MEQACTREEKKQFCRAYLQTLNPTAAAAVVGRRDGYAILRDRTVKKLLGEMRETVASEILREDAVRRLCELAFGRANDGVKLAVSGCRESLDLAELDLSAVAECKVTDKGGLEVKFIDRIRALETLCGLLGGDDEGAADAFFHALEEAGDTEGVCG